MADWLDMADKLASVVGALAGVAALVITIRSKPHRGAPVFDAAAPRVEPVQSEKPVSEATRTPVAVPSAWQSLGSLAWSDVGNTIGLLALWAGPTLVGAWLLSWSGGGSIGPWWILVGLSVSTALGHFFQNTGFFRDTGMYASRGEILLYVLWVPAAAWLTARGFAYYWCPGLFGSQGTTFGVVFYPLLLVGVIGGLVKRFSSY